jgi:hypothetical protein
VLDVLSVTHHILNIRFDFKSYLLFLLLYEEQCWRTRSRELEHGLGLVMAHLREVTTVTTATAGIGL